MLIRSATSFFNTHLNKRAVYFLICLCSAVSISAWAQTASPQTEALITAARSQIGVTRHYSGGYVQLAYPGGDVPLITGVCTDVLIRAYRTAFKHDLQKSVHEDMSRHFSLYPKTWGLKRPDRNIDHRRVPNLQIFFSRHGTTLPVSQSPKDYKPGDLVTQMINGRLPHIAIVSDRLSTDDRRPLIIHNIGGGAQEEDALFAHPITGHYRYMP